MGVLSFGAGVSTGWLSAASVARIRWHIEPAVISITPQRKLHSQHFPVATLLLGLLLLLSLLLCSEAAVVLTVGTAIRTISRNYLQTNSPGRHVDGDTLNSSGDGGDPLAKPSNSSKRW
jgi:hypothetical protein